MNTYFIAGDRLLAFNAKWCTSSFARAIIKSHHPDVEEYIQTKLHLPEGRDVETEQHHSLVPKRFNPDRPVALLVREPVSRFKSALSFMHLENEVDKVLDAIINEDTQTVLNGVGIPSNARFPLVANIHLRHQYRLLHDVNEAQLFRMPDQIDECAEWLGLETPLVRINESRFPKPELTEDQIDRVKLYYKKDIELWESING